MIGRPARWIVFVVMLAVATALAFGWARHRRDTVAWQAAVEAPADLTDRLPEFRGRVADLLAWLRNRDAERDIAALGELAQLYQANGYVHEASVAHVALLRFDAENARWPHLLAHMLAGHGRLEEAVPLWRRSTELAPEYVPAHLRLGDALTKLNQPEEARASYLAALEREPGNPYALLGLARVELQTDRLTAARERLQQAVAAQPDFGAAWHLLATVYQRLGNAAGAASAQARAEGQRRFREPPDPWLDALLNDCYDIYRLRVAASAAGAAGANAEAMRWLERAAALVPTDADVQREMGGAAMELRNVERARACYRQAIALAPHDERNHLRLVEACANTGDAAGALRAAEAGVAACPESAALWFALGGQRISAGRAEGAIPAFEKARKLQPDKPDAYHQIAAIHFRLGRDAEGVAVLEDALQQVPEQDETLLALIRRGIETGNEQLARQWLERARRRGGLAAEGAAALAAEFARRFGRAP